jgi:hypothetical protein
MEMLEQYRGLCLYWQKNKKRNVCIILSLVRDEESEPAPVEEDEESDKEVLVESVIPIPKISAVIQLTKQSKNEYWFLFKDTWTSWINH